MFFDKIPLIVYQDRLVADLTRTVKRRSDADLSRITTSELVRDGETIEGVAFRIYEETKWWWVVAMVNGITDPFQWPLSGTVLNSYIDTKYGKDRYSTRHFVGDEGRIIPDRSPITFQADGETVDWQEYGEGLGAERNGYIFARGTPVTNEEYEIDLNDKKRNIRVLARDYLDDFVNDFNRKIRQ